MAKARIVVDRDGEHWSLLSVKRAEGEPKHGKLEMLGGHLDGDENPVQALERELREEERNKVLSKKVHDEPPAYLSLLAGGALHHIFFFDVDEAELSRLEYDPEESMGFELVRTSELEAGEHEDRLTPRTRKIFEALRRQKERDS